MNLKTKNNYLSWQIDSKEFPENGTLDEQLKFLLRFGILAPSGHNSQPWEFEIVENLIIIKINPKRSLAESDPEGRQLNISFGCLLENILIAADYFGFTTEFISNSKKSKVFGELRLNRKIKTQNNQSHLLHFIPKRLTNRFEYKNTYIEDQIIKDIFSGIENEINYILTQGEIKNILAKLMCDAQIYAMDSSIFRAELSGFLKSGRTNSYVGMTGSTLGIPLVISFFAPLLIKKMNIAKKGKKKDLELLTKYTPYIGVLLSREDNKNSWVKTGQTLEKIWLKAGRFGLALSPLAAAAQLDIFRQKVKAVLGTNLFPQAIFRLGYPNKNAGHSPRFLINNLVR